MRKCARFFFRKSCVVPFYFLSLQREYAKVKTKMKKRLYQQPSMKVVDLPQRTMLLSGSVDPLDPFHNGGDPLNS